MFDAIDQLVERVPGTVGAAIVDPDGIPVRVAVGGDWIEELGAEYSTVIRDIERAGRELDHGRLSQVVVEADQVTLVLTRIRLGYFLVHVVERDGLIGKGKFVSRLVSERLSPEFS